MSEVGTPARGEPTAEGALDVALELRGVEKRFGDVQAVASLDLTLYAGEFLTLLGPSGCGKTTALRLIAGFESVDAGSIHFQGREVTRQTPQRRGFGMVFQNYALFPHLSVFENVAFGLRTRKRPKPEIEERVAASLRRVDLADYGERAVQALSGGQQQRVALARALAIEPPLLLLDEPLSNLDAALREQTRAELRTLVKELGITAIFVTHDQEEAYDLSDRIAVMRSGRLRQLGTPEELYQRPADRFVAGFVGRANTLRGVVEDADGGAVLRLSGDMWWPLPETGFGSSEGVARGQEADALVRPEALHPVEVDSEHAGLRGTVRDVRFRGAVSTAYVDVPGVGEVEVTGSDLRIRAGESIGLAPRPDAGVHLFPLGDED